MSLSSPRSKDFKLAHLREFLGAGRGCKPNAIKLRINSFSFNRIFAWSAHRYDIFWCRRFKNPKPTEWLNAGLPYFATPNQLGPAPRSMPLN